MKIETDFNIGQKVWFYANGARHPFMRGEIHSVTIDAKVTYRVSYTDNDPHSKTLRSDEIFLTAKALSDHLYSQVAHYDEQQND